jgi:hypothetical protein
MDVDRAIMRRRSGFALFAIVIGIVVITMLATLMMAPVSGDNRQERIQRTADVLHRLVAEMDSASGNMINYFRGHMQSGGGAPNTRQKWPGRLSHLYTQPLGTDLACSGSTYTAEGVTVTSWRGPYHLVPIRNTGHNIAPGFFADDALVRVSNTEAYIRIQNVDLDDAEALDLTVDGAANAAAGAVRYAPTNATPVVVQYRFISVGHNPCG